MTCPSQHQPHSTQHSGYVVLHGTGGLKIGVFPGVITGTLEGKQLSQLVAEGHVREFGSVRRTQCTGAGLKVGGPR